MLSPIAVPHWPGSRTTFSIHWPDSRTNWPDSRTSQATFSYSIGPITVLLLRYTKGVYVFRSLTALKATKNYLSLVSEAAINQKNPVGYSWVLTATRRLTNANA